jgi:hypothetical protein
VKPPAADVIPGRLWLREDDGFVTFEPKLPKQ